MITTAVLSIFFTSGFRRIYSEPSLGPPPCDLGVSFHVLPVPSSSSDRARGALSVLCSCELTCATGGTFRLRIYIVYENVIRTRAAINAASCLAVSGRTWVEPQEMSAVSVSAPFVSAGRCCGWLLAFQPVVMGRDGDSPAGTASPFLSWCARRAGRDPSAAGVKGGGPAALCKAVK